MDTVDAAAFEREVLASPVPVIVDFWAPWCKPCDAIEPHLRAISDEHDVRLVKLNIDESIVTPSRYGVLALPTVMLFADGEPCVTVFGAQPRGRYEKDFAPFF